MLPQNTLRLPVYTIALRARLSAKRLTNTSSNTASLVPRSTVLNRSSRRLQDGVNIMKNVQTTAGPDTGTYTK